MAYLFDCSTCKNRCDGKSLGFYQFKSDVEYSEYFENKLIEELTDYGYYAKKTNKDGYPDIEVYPYKGGPIRCYIEVKAQRRTFMAVTKYLPKGNLIPSETVALNESDLVRYFKINKIEPVPIYVLWVLSERPCIVPPGQHQYFYQNITVLEEIYNHYTNKRRFKRKSGKGDIVNNQHKGVVVNYHFSLRELLPFRIDDI